MNRRELFRMLSGGIAGIPAVKSIETLSVKPDDTIVFTYQEYLRPDDIAHIQDVLSKVFPRQKCLVLQAGADLKVIRS